MKRLFLVSEFDKSSYLKKLNTTLPNRDVINNLEEEAIFNQLDEIESKNRKARDADMRLLNESNATLSEEKTQEQITINETIVKSNNIIHSKSKLKINNPSLNTLLMKKNKTSNEKEKQLILTALLTELINSYKVINDLLNQAHKAVRKYITSLNLEEIFSERVRKFQKKQDRDISKNILQRFKSVYKKIIQVRKKRKNNYN